jgi:Photosynthetic reaction centre cytochrome C subunit
MKSNVRKTVFWSGLISAGLMSIGLIQGQVATTNAPPPASQPHVHAKPTNLKVLPKEMSGEDIDKLMHRYQQYLGVSCGYCHEQDPETKTIDFASDLNPEKETARFMITLTSDINNKYLSKLGESRYADPITCGNCHRGQVQPPNFEIKPYP